jgi:CRP/FNR family transcriptional regulator, cyclic AMP receptor protein
MNLEHGEIVPMRVDMFEIERSFDVGALGSGDRGIRLSGYPLGEILFNQGDPADSLYFIQQGFVRITTVSARGKEANIAVIGINDFFGEGCLIGHTTRVATATCLSDCMVVRLEQASAIRALRQNRPFAEFFVARIVTSLVQLREVVVSHILESSEVRLARILMRLANYDKNSQGRNPIINVGQEELGNMVGTTRSRINHFMTKFRKLGHIQYDGTAIVVHKSLSRIIRT